MKTEYKYVYFVKLEDKPKTSVWSCRNIRSDAELGIIKWHSPWRQYCYFTTTQWPIIYSTDCFEDINHFIKQLDFERSKEKENGKKSE